MITQTEINGLLYTKSDTYTIIQNETGIEYTEAYDVIPCKYTYKESENRLPEDTSKSEEDKKEE